MIYHYLLVQENNLADLVSSENTIMTGNPQLNWQPFGGLTAVPDDTAQPRNPHPITSQMGEGNLVRN